MNPPVDAEAAEEGFLVVGFAIDGTLVDKWRWLYRDLSAKWSNICEDLLSAKGVNFDYTWQGPLSHIRTKLTSARGAGICTLFVNDHVASSNLLLRGHDRAVEHDVSRMFVSSLRNVHLVQAATTQSEPFAEVLSLSERPLMVIVPIPDDSISDQDNDVVQELSVHLASAFLRSDQ
jgi:hypothetical protein